MLQEAIYERQNRITELSIPKVASVVGCGGTGFWTALFLAMSGVKELILLDSDTIELSNLNRIPVTERYVGKNKTDTTKEFIGQIRSSIRIESHNMKIEKSENCEILRGMVFCCTDNLKSQQLICAYCRKNNLPYQRIGYDGTILNVSKAFPLSFEEATNEGGYSVTPSWVVPAAFAATAGVSSRLYKELCLMDDIGKVHIQECSTICPKFLDDATEKGIKQGQDEILDNIDDHIPSEYGYCNDCDRGDCSNCDYVDPNDGYGYCQDCDERYSEDDIEEIKENSRIEGFDNAIQEILSGDVENSELLDALEEWVINKESEQDE